MGTSLTLNKIKQKFSKKVTSTPTPTHMPDHDFYKVIKDNSSLLDMLMYRRPSRKMTDPTYAEFLNKYIKPLFGEPDEHGNFVVIIPTDGKLGDPVHEHNIPRVCYTAHHDTVHNTTGKQTGMLYYNKDPINGNPSLIMNQGTVATDTYLWVVNTALESKTETYYQQMWDPVLKKTMPKEMTRIVKTPNPKNSSCLGADCTTGVWLICEMIKANCPGTYCIFADEEVGGIGSRAIASSFSSAKAQVAAVAALPFKCFKSLCDNVISWDTIPFEDKKQSLPYSYWVEYTDVMISFDRKNTTSIITRQSGGTCASQLFVNDLSGILSPMMVDQNYGKFIADNGGTFTDSASFMKFIPECTNLSVGYLNQHQEAEIQNYSFAVALRDTLIANAHVLNDPTKLGHYRDPVAVEVHSFASGTYSTGVAKHSNYGSPFDKNQGHGYKGSGYMGYQGFDDDDYDWYKQTPAKTTPVVPVVPVVVKPNLLDFLDEGDDLVNYAQSTLPIDNFVQEFDDRVDQLYDDALTDYDHENKISITALSELIDHMDEDIDTFGEFCLSQGITTQDYTNYVLNRKLSILEKFKSYLIDFDITMTDEEIEAYVNQSH